MPDIEKVKKGLKCCLTFLDSPCEDCPYNLHEDMQEFDCERNLLKDAIALLKEQGDGLKHYDDGSVET